MSNQPRTYSVPGLGRAQVAANALYDKLRAAGLHTQGVSVSWDGRVETVTISCVPSLWAKIEPLANQVGLTNPV
jgi:hypothetical protein